MDGPWSGEFFESSLCRIQKCPLGSVQRGFLQMGKAQIMKPKMTTIGSCPWLVGSLVPHFCKAHSHGQPTSCGWLVVVTFEGYVCITACASNRLGFQESSPPRCRQLSPSELSTAPWLHWWLRAVFIFLGMLVMLPRNGYTTG